MQFVGKLYADGGLAAAHKSNQYDVSHASFSLL